MAKSKDAKKIVSLDNLMGFVRKGAKVENVAKIPTGYFELDYAINFGMLPGNSELGTGHKVYDPTKPLGIPCGRLVEIFGPEGGGKSYICYRLTSMAQKLGYKTAWIDTEQSFSEDLAVINDVDLDELYLADMRNLDEPDKVFYAEDVLDNIIDLMKCGVKLIILDSVANLVPREMMESSSDDQFVARLARLLSQNMGKITQWAGKTDSLVVFINQIREKPMVMFGDAETTPGGRALKHNASLRLKITKRTGNDSCIIIDDPDTTDGKRLIGRNSYVSVVKNRFARPLLDAKGSGISIDIPIYYEHYFPDIENIIFDAARQSKIIKVYKGAFNWKDKDGEKHEAEDRSQFIALMKSDTKMTDEIVASLEENSSETGVPLPPEILQYTKNQSKDEKPKKTKKSKDSKEEVGAEEQTIIDDDLVDVGMDENEEGSEEDEVNEKSVSRGRKKNNT